VHDAAPVLAAKYPDGQVVHEGALVVLEYEPAAQLVQA